MSINKKSTNLPEIKNSIDSVCGILKAIVNLKINTQVHKGQLPMLVLSQLVFQLPNPYHQKLLF